MIEPAIEAALDPRVEQIEREVIQLRDQVAVAAEHLVVAVPAVLARGHVRRHDAGVRVRRPIDLQHAAQLIEAGTGQPVGIEAVGRDVEEARHRRVRVEAAAGADIAHGLRGKGPEQRQRGARHRSGRGAGGAAMAGGRPHVHLSAEPRAVAGPERRDLRKELDAAAERVAAVLGAVRSAQHFDPLEIRLVNQVEERVDTAALGAVRIADTIHEHVHLVAGQAADENASHGRARALQGNTGLFAEGLRCYDRRPLLEVGLRDHVDCLRGTGDVQGCARRSGDRYRFTHTGDRQRQCDRRRRVRGDVDRSLTLLEPLGPRDYQVTSRFERRDRERAVGGGVHGFHDSTLRRQDRDARAGKGPARRIGDPAPQFGGFLDAVE